MTVTASPASGVLIRQPTEILSFPDDGWAGVYNC